MSTLVNRRSDLWLVGTALLPAFIYVTAHRSASNIWSLLLFTTPILALAATVVLVRSLRGISGPLQRFSSRLAILGLVLMFVSLSISLGMGDYLGGYATLYLSGSGYLALYALVSLLNLVYVCYRCAKRIY